MRVRVLGMTAAAALSALAGPVLAQEARPLSVQAVLQETYDSNVARSNAALAAARRIEQEDFITEPSIAVNLTKAFGRQTAFLKGSVGYDFYARNTELNSERIDLQGGLKARLSSCKGEGSVDYARQQSDLQQLSVAVTQNVQETTTIDLEGDCGGEVGLTPKVSFTQQWVNNSASQMATSNYDHTTVTPGVAYRRPGFGELWAYGTYDEAHYPNRSGQAGAIGNDPGYKDYGGGIRYDRRLGARLETTVKVGYSSLRPSDPRLTGFEGMTWGFDGTLRMSGRLQGRLTFERAAVPANRPNVTYAVENSVLGQVDYAAGPKLKLTLGASTSNNRYHGAALNPFLDVANETVTDVFGAMKFAIGPRLAIQLDGRHEIRHANVSAYSYADDRISLSLIGGI